MVKTIVRAVFLFALAIMIVTYALTPSDSKPADPDQALPTDRMYS